MKYTKDETREARKATEKALSRLHRSVTASFLMKIRSGTATSQDLAAASKFLKDNNITVDTTIPTYLNELEETLRKAGEGLPFPGGDTYVVSEGDELRIGKK